MHANPKWQFSNKKPSVRRWQLDFAMKLIDCFVVSSAMTRFIYSILFCFCFCFWYSGVSSSIVVVSVHCFFSFWSTCMRMKMMIAFEYRCGDDFKSAHAYFISKAERNETPICMYGDRMCNCVTWTWQFSRNRGNEHASEEANKNFFFSHNKRRSIFSL